MSGRPYLIPSLLGTLLLAGCGFGAVDVEPYDAAPGSSDLCAALLEGLPETVGDAVRRDVDPPSDLVAAWGQPAIVLRCGVAMPSSYRPDTQLYDVNGVGWLADEGDGGTFFTVADREIVIEVAVPDDYRPEGTVLADLAPTILTIIPERPRADPRVSADP